MKILLYWSLLIASDSKIIIKKWNETIIKKIIIEIIIITSIIINIAKLKLIIITVEIRNRIIKSSKVN